ncbi:Sodium-dependent nutrient amino acid transporter 1 [Orchesella cincta]|uniref:Sodium-dependent nutrient amino acid transporter 1 n=1 Tax=Orchesella cincta TaxID=48709 RepID=A0A1D2MUU9_ORCCI|nr:Sodium-dependent nutrient amino acid transporter 1 [Orchesella cincta]
MAYNQQNGQSLYHDNHGYVRDGSEAATYAQSPIEPAPRQFLPRIITGSEVGGQKIKPESQPPAYGAEHPQPRFAVKNNDPGQIATITPAQPPATGDEGPGDERDTWDNPLEFLLSCISMSVGLGNVWRFPGVAARNGGGAFLIPYLVVLLVIGRPLYYLEMCIGQFSRYGQVKVWNMAPIFKGVGYGSITAVCCVVSYYVALMGITLFFFFSSFQKDLPWGQCDDEGKPFNCSEVSPENYAAYYYNYEVLPQIPKIDDGLGELNWRVSLCLVLAWILIFLSLVKGVKSSGKVAYFTAIFPYVVLLILLIRGVTLKGAWSGIKYFITPEWSVLYKPKVWYNAISQCFFSLSAGFGPVIMFSSYNNFRQNVYKDALIISFMDTFTSLLAGCTIFSVMGNLVEESETLEFEDIDGGPGLAFILYPQAITKFGSTPFPQIFAVLFFLMLFTLGLGSATSLAGGIITIICDQFTTMKRWLVTLIVCTGGCLVGLLYVTEGGMLMLDLIDHYGSGFVVYVMAMLECAGISYVYGLSNICNDIEFMLGRHVGIYWRICWGFILPVGLLANLLYYLISEPEFQSGPYPYPQIATIFGWLLTAFAAGLIPAWAIHAIATRKKETLKEKFVEACKPTHRWGPQNKKLRSEWLAFRAQKDAEASKKRFLIF